MGLLAANDVRAIHRLAVDNGLAAVREMLWVDFDRAVVSSNRATAGPGTVESDLLRLDLNNLNENPGRTADGKFLLQIFLETCALRLEAAQPAQAQLFRDWSAKLDALPAQPEPNVVQDVSALRNELNASVPSDAASQLAADLEGFIGGLAKNADRLLRAKRLHDKLHELQTLALPILRRLGGMGSALTPFAPLILNSLGMVEGAATFATNQVANLDPADSLRVQSEALAKSLGDIVTAASAAVNSDKLADYIAALGLLRDRIKDDMSNFESQIHQQLGTMQPGQPNSLEQLSLMLKRLAETAVKPAVKAAAEGALQSLGLIAQNLSMIGQRHHEWQTLDAQLWVLEDVFNQVPIAPGFGLIFKDMWSNVTRQLSSLAGSPKPEWSVRTDKLSADFVAICPQPPGAPLDAAAPDAFLAVIGEARKAFREVDLKLQASCEQLAMITAQLVL